MQKKKNNKKQPKKENLKKEENSQKRISSVLYSLSYLLLHLYCIFTKARAALPSASHFKTIIYGC